MTDIILPPPFKLFDREVQPDAEGFYCEIFSSKELTNDQYHDETDHVSGSQLFKLLDTCPAKMKNGVELDEEGNPVDEKARALSFGSCAHTNLLERAVFEKEYLRGTRKEDAERLGGELLTSKKACESWLKARGVSGYSGKDYPVLVKMIRAAQTHGEVVHILDEIVAQEESLASSTGRKLIRGDDYDNCLAMREVLFANSDIEEVLTKGEPEVSIFTVLRGVPVKVRLDYVWSWTILDYKTTQTAKPDDFSRLAYRLGYYLKMALQRQVFKKAYGELPKFTKLLAQEKKYPFISQEYDMSEEQFKIGDVQLSSALETYRVCKEKDIWPGYCNGNKAVLPTPKFVLDMYKDYIK